MINRLLSIHLPLPWLTQNIQRWLRLLVVASVLLLSAVLPFRTSPSQLARLLGLLPAIVAILSFMHWPPLGLVALIITSLLVPSPRLPGGLNIAVLLLALLLGLWLVDMTVRQRHIQLVPSRTVRPLLALVVIASLSFGFGQLPWFLFARQAPLDAQLGGLAIFLLSVGVFLLVAHQVRDLRWLEWLTWLFLALGGLYITIQLLPELEQFLPRFQYGAEGSLFWIWLVALAFSQAVFNRRLHPFWRLAIGGLVLATFYVAIIQNGSWKSGWIPPLVTIAAIIGLRSWRVGLILALAGLVLVPEVSSRIVATDQYSYSTRIEAWLILAEMLRVNPILGLGPANYYWYTPLFPIRGYYVRFNSHNNYVDIVAQTGLLGLACFLWFAWEIGWLGWRLREQAPEGFARAYVYGALGGLAGTLFAGMLGDWVLPFVYNIGLTGFRASVLGWLFLGGLVALEQIYANRTPDGLKN